MSMTRLILTGSNYTFGATWLSHTLYGVACTNKLSGDVIGYDVYFPYAVGGSSREVGAKNVWYFRAHHVKVLDDLKYSEKPRYTLVKSKDHIGESVWAKVVSQDMNKGCTGCSFQAVPCGSLTPACDTYHRHNQQAVIFITEVAKW